MDAVELTDRIVLFRRWERAWTRADMSPVTLRNYQNDVARYLIWCEEHGLNNASLDAADEFVGHRESDSKYAGRNTARALKAWGKFLADMYDETDPFKRLVVPKTPTPVKTPTATDDDLEKLLATCDTSDWLGLRDKAMILLIAHTGMRRGEVANMKVEDLDLASQPPVLHIPKTKTKAPRTVFLHEDVVDAIIRYRRKSPARDEMWPSGSNNGFLGSIGREGIGQMIKRREEQAGISLGTHAWRRKFAGDWIAAEGTEVGLMNQAGWTSTKMIAHYSKGVAQQNSIAEAERLSKRS